MSFAAAKNVTIDLRHHDADSHGNGDTYDSRVVASVRVAF